MKQILTFTCFVMLSIMLKAQSPNFGIKAGLNLATITGDDAADYAFIPSFYAGGLAHIHLNEDFAIQPELLFSGQGSKYKIAGDEIKINLAYITLPVLLQYMFNNGFRLETGPQIGVLADAQSKTGDVSTDVKDGLNTMDFSWAFGAGYILDSGWGVDARYNLGISNINKDNPPKLRNGVIAVGLFYQFKGKEH